MKFPKLSFDPLSKGFVLYKPLQMGSYDEAEINQLDKDGNLLITRKRDGWKLFAVKSKDRWRIYTDGLRDITDRLPHIIRELGALNIGNESILAGEGLIDEKGKDNFEKVGSILHSGDAGRAIGVQKDIGQIKLMLFEIVYWEGKCTLDSFYGFHICMIQEICSINFRYIIPIQLIDLPLTMAQALVRKNKWEGLVLYAKNFRGTYRTDGGSPKRPIGCYKWKPIYEDDFIAYDWVPSENNPKRLKEVRLAQIDPKTGQLFDCGKHGTFDNNTRELLQKADYPLTVQLQFELRYPSGKLRNKVYMRIRDDKKPASCIAPKHYKKSTPVE